MLGILYDIHAIPAVTMYLFFLVADHLKIQIQDRLDRAFNHYSSVAEEGAQSNSNRYNTFDSLCVTTVGVLYSYTTATSALPDINARA